MGFPDPCVIDCDNNLGGPTKLAKRLGKPFTYCTVSSDDEGKPVKPFKQYHRFADELAQAKDDPRVKTIIIDSITSLANIIKFDIFRQRVSGQNVGGGNKVMITESNLQIAQFTEPEWGIFSRYWENLISEVRSWGKIIVFTAHCQVLQNKQSQVFQEVLALEGSMRFKFAAYFSDVILCRRMVGSDGNARSSYQTIPKDEYDARGLKASDLELPPLFDNFAEIQKQFQQPETDKTETK